MSVARIKFLEKKTFIFLLCILYKAGIHYIFAE